ncbi:MAG TPA: transcriptional regulator [Actinobacteria bacterium]|jgi:hypothetical protein|nr:transcriptional regulator [Actinomycetota bacterium]
MTDYTVISRELTLPASADAISAWIVDFHKWVSWSPWEDIDPNLQRTYSGPPSGVGTAYEWSGNRKAGAGKMTITSVAPEEIKLDLDFTKPFKSASKTTFTLAAGADGTTVVWQVFTPKSLMTRIFGIFMNFDKMVGADLERGLAKLKSVVA